MHLPTRESTHNVDAMLSDVIHQALRDDRTIEIVKSDGSLVIEIDGVEVTPIASESFDWPLDRYDFEGDAAELVEECLERRRKRRIERRKEKLSTENQAESEGIDSA